MYSEKDKEYILTQIDEIADEILEISAGMGSCGDAIACEKYSSKLIASVAAIRATKKKISNWAGAIS